MGSAAGTPHALRLLLGACQPAPNSITAPLQVPGRLLAARSPTTILICRHRLSLLISAQGLAPMQPERSPPSDSRAAAKPQAAAEAPKGTWDIVLTTTPVVLTVLGTVLAGLSNSEMTLAQYFRTLAAQSQSKV